MSVEQLTTLVTLVAALSVAAERIAEIVSKFFKGLAVKKDDAREEARRQLWIHLITIGAGIGVAALAQPIFSGLVPETWNPVARVIGLSILASGGADSWNKVSGWVAKVKEARDAQAAQEEAAANKLTAERIAFQDGLSDEVSNKIDMAIR